MVKQTLISFKVDSDQLEKLDHWCELLGVKRNKLLNFLVVFGNNMFLPPQDVGMMHAYQDSLSKFLVERA